MYFKKILPVLIALTLFLTSCGGAGKNSGSSSAEASGAAADSQDVTADSASATSDATADAAGTQAEATTDAAATTDGAATAAGDQNESAAADSQAAAATTPAASPISITIPAQYMETFSQEDLDEFAAEFSLDSFTLNADGTATMNATKEAHAAMLTAIANELGTTISEIPNYEDLPNIQSVTYSQDFTSFTIAISGSEVAADEQLLAEYYCLSIADYFKVYSGSTQDTFHIDWVEQETGNVFISEDKTFAEAREAVGYIAENFEAETATYNADDPARAALRNAIQANLVADFSQTLVDNDKIHFEITGASVDDFAYYWTYRAENKTDETLSFSSSVNTSVNGIVCGPTLILELEAGASADGKLYWDLTSLLDAHLTDVTIVDFGLSVYENTRYDSVYEGFTTVYPAGEANAKTEYYTVRENEDTLIMDDATAKIVVTSYELSDYGDLIASIYIQNNSDMQLTFDAKDFKLDGVEAPNFWMSIMPAGKAAYSEIGFAAGMLEDKPLSSVNEVTFTLICYAEDNPGDPIATVPVTLHPTFG